MFAIILSWINGTVGNSSKVLGDKIHSIDEGTKNRIIIPLVGVATVLILYTVNVPAMLASTELIQALTAQSGGPEVNLAKFKKALSYHSFGDSEIHEQLVQTASQAAGVQNVDPKIKNELFDLTKKEMLLQLERTPQDARYFLFTGSFLSSYGDADNAIVYLKKAHELSPNKQTILFSLASAYLGKKDYDNAVATMKQAFELDQTFAEARRIYGLILVYAKKPKEAEEILKPLSVDLILGDERFTAAFYAGGYFENALESVNFLLKKDPTSVQYYFTRAVILNQLGRTTAAIADLKKVGELNPSAKAQADSLIEQVRAGKSI
jgi:tetratricopeptide (TPR) repeat protein